MAWQKTPPVRDGYCGWRNDSGFGETIVKVSDTFREGTGGLLISFYGKEEPYFADSLSGEYWSEPIEFPWKKEPMKITVRPVFPVPADYDGTDQ